MKSIFTTAVLATVILCGCSGGRSLTGKWNVTPSGDLPKGTTMTAEFSGADALAMTMDMPQDLPDGKQIKLHADIKGTYKLEGDRLTVKADDVKFTGSGFPDELKGQLEPMLKGMGDQVKDQINKEGSTVLAWKDDDTFTLTGKKGNPETFTRVK
ncbi:MAG TPA: hypothetical protein VM328_08290 [Fimbriimonadaceae bacterium]|nr:hypothetical protein [Fimbriimonadaceae bacterium]